MTLDAQLLAATGACNSAPCRAPRNASQMRKQKGQADGTA